MLRAVQLMILGLLTQALTVFGLNFDVTLLSLTNNNTSACSNYSPAFGGLVEENFGPTSVVDTNGDTININSNLVDMSLNPVTPGHVSHTDVHSLIPSRPDLRWFANGTCWWGEGPSHHIDNGTTNTTAAYAAALVTDMGSRGFDGLIFSWYGKGDQTDTVAKNVKAFLDSTNNPYPNFTITIMIVMGDFVGGETVANVESNILYCQTNYFNDAHYETEQGHPLLMFFNVSPAYFSESQMDTMKSDTSSNTYWVQEGVGEIGDSWVNMTYFWTDNYDQGNTNELSSSTPYNLNVVTNQYSTVKANPSKQSYGAMCAHFNGTLTKSYPWSLGKYLPSGGGLCEYYRAQEINQVIPTNMTRMQWATWSDYEEGTEVEVGTENYFALTTSVNSSNILSWTITSGDERTINHYDVYALTNGGNAAYLCSVTNGTHQTSLTGLGLVPGSYQLYVDAVGIPCVRDHLSSPVSYSGQAQTLPSPWVSQDIGSPGAAGSATYTNGNFTVNGSGLDIWGTSDSYQFVYQPWTGDGQIVAEVTSVQNTDPWAKAGIMFRETLGAGSSEGTICLTPGNGVSMLSRTNTGGTTATVNTLAGLTAPKWLLLVRSGNLLTGYESADGATWTAVGTNTVPMAASLYVGLAVTSKTNTILNTSTFTNVAVSLPSPWQNQDIGSVGLAGSTSYTNGVFNVTGSGFDIWSTNDSFQFVYQPWTGDGQIVAQVVSIQNTAPWAKATLMFRETLAPGSAEGDLFVTPSSGVSLQGRTVANANASNVNTLTNPTAPCWLMLSRTGNILSGYESPDGTNWTLVGTNVYTMTNTIYVGMGVVSRSNTVLNTSLFANVTVTNNGYAAGWSNPSAIVYGTALGAAQNDATASVPGTFVYTPANGTVLPAGTNTLTVVFTPTDPGYAATNLNVTLVVTPAALTITANSTNKVYNTTLTLGAGQTAFTTAGLVSGDTVGSVTLASSGAVSTAPVGSYAIVPSLAMGGTFNPANYSITYDNGTLTVGQGIYTAGWPAPASIVYGTALSATQNNATSSIAGTFVYTPANGTDLPAGTNTLATVFTPSNTNYAGTNLTASLVVTPAALTITANSTNKVYNTTLTLGAGQTAFTSAGLVLGQTVGSVTLTSSGAVNTAPVGSYAIVPSLATGGTINTNNYSITYGNGTLTVGQGVYAAGWPAPASIVYGTALSATQNNATSSIAGTFVYTPANGTVPPAGTNTLTTVFTPSNTNYAGTNLTATLVVTPAALTITADSTNKLFGTTLTLGAGQTAFTSAGLVSGDTVGSVTLTSSGAVSTAPVGSYSIVPSLATGGTFNPTNYSIAYDNGTLTVVALAGLPAPWTNQDIGAVGLAGSASYSNGTFTVTGAGFDIWGTNDSFQFVYQPWTGDGQIVARVVSIQNTAPWAKAALIYRETLAPGSADGDLFVTPSSGVSLQGRTVANAVSSNVNTVSNLVAPCWLKLQRVGNILSGYESSNAVNWTLVGTNVYTMTNAIYVGLGVVSRSNAVLNTSVFDNVTVSGAWLNQDIGNVGVAGSSSINYSNGLVTVSGAGFDIWGSGDECQYLYQTFSGDSAIIAQVTGVQGTAPWAKASLMFRETLATNARNSILFLCPSNGVQLQGRTATAGSTVAIVNITNLVAPQWLQLVRSSQNMNAYLSPDGVNWSWIGTQTNPMSINYEVGLAVTSRTNTALNTSTFDNISVQNAWVNGDIGNVGVAGSMSINNANGTNSVFTVSGSGTDIWSTNDAFQFVGQPLYGNGQIVARVLSVQETDPWSKAGVMIRDTEAPNAINALLFVAGASTNGVAFQGRTATGGSTSTFLSVGGLSAPYWLKLARSGSSLTAYGSADGATWTQVGSAETITMSTNALVGLVVGSKNNTELNTSTFDNVTVTPTP